MQYSGSTNDGQDADELVSVWSLLDGTESRVLKHKLGEVLRKRTLTGEQVFWIPGMPGKPQKLIRDRSCFACYILITTKGIG